MRRFKHKKIFIYALKFLGLFLFVLLIVYLAVNGPAVLKKLKYKTKISNLIRSRELQMAEAEPPPDLGNRLIIPKINIDAPIVFSESTKEKELMKDLEQGVVLWPDTAFPGEEGNCVITGHSSDFFWHEGNFKTVFALLNELEINDSAIVFYDQQKFIYRVVGKDIVLSNNVSILSQNKKDPLTGSVGPTLTLFTCWPLGTDLRRLVIEAQLL